MDKATLQQITAGNPGVLVVLSAADLKEAMGELYKNEQAKTAAAIAAHRERPTLTRQEAAQALNVTLTTLWRWDKIGYLQPVKIGTKVLYKATDIDAILNQRTNTPNYGTPSAQAL